MKNILKQTLKQKINQLEESYHFNLKDFSFIYNEKKAFIIDIRKRATMVNPFLHYRKELDQFITSFTEDRVGAFDDADQFNKYLHKCIAIIANMLDHTKMGSVESYIDHIWKSFDTAINEESSEPMQEFINDVSNIVTMIDYTIETQLVDLDKGDMKSLIAQSIVDEIDPTGVNVISVEDIGDGGAIKRIKCDRPNKSNKPKELDLRNIRPLNTKEI